MAVGGEGTIAAAGRHYCLYSAERYRHSLFMSDDGETWVERNRVETSSTSSPVLGSTFTLQFSRSDADVLYSFPNTVSSTSPLAVSRDGGSTWTTYTSPVSLTISNRVLSHAIPSALMLRDADWNRYVSWDFGLTWTNVDLAGSQVTLLQHDGRTYAYGLQLPGCGISTTSNFFQSVEAVGCSGLTTAAGPRSVVPLQNPTHVRSYGPEWSGALIGFLSTDRGISWNRTDTPGRTTAQSPADPNRWYIATNKGDVYRSSDDASKYALAGTLQNYSIPRALAPSHSDPNLVYALTNGGVYRSSNAGATWRWASTNLTATGQLALIVDPTNHNTLYTGGGFGVHKSTDGGNDWRRSSNGLTNTSVVTLAVTSDGSTLFAGTGSGSIYRSLDAANTWEWVNEGFESYRVTDLAVDPNDDNVVYAATIGGVYKSRDKGSSWTLASAGMYSPFISWLTIAPDSNTLYAGTQDHGIYRGTPTNETGAAFPTSVLALAEEVARTIASQEDGH